MLQHYFIRNLVLSHTCGKNIYIIFYFMCAQQHWNNYHKMRALKQHTFIFSHFPWVRRLNAIYLDPLLRVSQSWNQGISWLHVHLNAQIGKYCFQVLSGCWRNLSSYNYGTEVSTFLLAAKSSMLPSVPCCVAFSMGSS